MTENFNTATIALLASITSATFTGIGLAWNIALYRLSGPRISVRLRPAKIDSESTLLEGPDEGWSGENPTQFKTRKWTVDLAEITVTNVGRSPVSASNISLDVKRSTQKRSRKDHTVSGFPAKIYDGLEKNSARLDAGESVRFSQ